MASGLTQQRVGSLANVSRRTLIRWESGEFSPWIPELVAVLDALALNDSQRRTLFERLDTQRSRTVRGPDWGGRFCDYLRLARVRAGRSTHNVAREMQCHQTTVVRWESGALRPNDDQFERLLRLLEIDSGETEELCRSTDEDLGSDGQFEEHLRGIVWPWDPVGHGLYDARFANLLYALEHVNEVVRNRWLIRSRVAYAWLLSASNRHSEAINQAERVIGLLRETPAHDVADLVFATVVMARGYARIGGPRGVKRSLEHLDALAGKPLSWELLAYRHDAYSECLTCQGSRKDALDHNSRADGSAARSGGRLRSIVRFNRVRILVETQDYQGALDCLPAFSEVTPLNETKEYLLLAAIYRALGQEPLAVHWHERAKTCAERFGLRRILGGASPNWGSPPLPV